MKKNIKLVLEYDGSRYDGWQRQGNTDNTIQGKIETVLQKWSGEEIEIHGSGRTDGGVHALGQIANFKLETELSAEEIMRYINRFLPDDIGIVAAWEADMRFHSRLSATGKTYRYRILTGEIPEVFGRRQRFWHKEKLDVAAMKKAAEDFIGKKDFMSFCDNKRMKKSTVREITSLDITENGNEIIIDVTGNGFLYHMVRIIAGTLIEIGEGKRAADSVPAIIEAKDREKAGVIAAAEGLTLMEVFYA